MLLPTASTASVPAHAHVGSGGKGARRSTPSSAVEDGVLTPVAARTRSTITAITSFGATPLGVRTQEGRCSRRRLQSSPGLWRAAPHRGKRFWAELHGITTTARARPPDQSQTTARATRSVAQRDAHECMLPPEGCARSREGAGVRPHSEAAVSSRAKGVKHRSRTTRSRHPARREIVGVARHARRAHRQRDAHGTRTRRSSRLKRAAELARVAQTRVRRSIAPQTIGRSPLTTDHRPQRRDDRSPGVRAVVEPRGRPATTRRGSSTTPRASSASPTRRATSVCIDRARRPSAPPCARPTAPGPDGRRGPHTASATSTPWRWPHVRSGRRATPRAPSRSIPATTR